MKKTTTYIVLMLFLTLTFAPSILGHSPISGAGESIETALEIEDPTKSWAVYSELHDTEEIKYYYFEIEEGEEIYISLYIPPNADTNFLPNLVLFGPGLPETTVIPPEVETPSSGGALLLDYYSTPNRFFEPFTPSVIIELGEISISAPASGIYYIAIYSNDVTGPFGFAIGRRESFTLDEIFLLPLRILEIYQWEGQLLFVIIAPLLLVLLFGSIFVLRYRKTHGAPDTILELFLIITGLFLIGSAANIAFQIVLKGILFFSLEIAVSLIFFMVPAIGGIGVLRLGLKHARSLTKLKRALIVTYGFLVIFLWTGYYIAPFLLFVAAFLKNHKIEEL